MYAPLGIKTDYSLLKSLIKIPDLIKYANDNNLKVLGILDDNLCASHMFYLECLKNDIKPIVGLDLLVNEFHIYLYPVNYNGLSLLYELSRYRLDNEVKVSDLVNYSNNVICVLPYESRSLYEEINNKFNKVFLSFKNKDEEYTLRVISDDVIFINVSLCINPNSSKYINYLTMIDKGLKLGDLELVKYDDNVLKLYDYDVTDFVNLIDIKFPLNNRYIPKYLDGDSVEYLKNLANKGLARRLNNEVSEVYQSRLDYELNIINSMGFTDYFLIVYDYVKFAIKNNIYVGAGRGSAAGSLVAYSLGITWIDPIKYDLLFERFLNPERVTMPDIDVDFEDARREEVVDYVKERYGLDNVGHILTYGTMTAKDVLRTVGKINNLDDKVIDYLTKYIDSKKSLKDNLSNDVKRILESNYQLKKVYEESLYLEGLKKHIGTHAAGVVISSKPLDTLTPIVKSGNEYLIGFEKDELEELGLIKMDFLSIRNLTIITNILKDIENDYGKKININAISLDDPKVFSLFSNADTVGVFQFESEGMKNFLKRLKPTVFDDLVMAIAIFRPGPMQSIDEYLERKNKGKKIDYYDDSLKPVLESTYGILIYQEQIMQILNIMGKFSFAEADLIRRGISKKKLSVIEENRTKFINNSVNNGYSKELAEEVFNLIVKFADFGFNKSHSVAYSMIAYQMAYLKVYFKEYYYINLLNMNIGGESKTKEYINEAKMIGIKFLIPDINKSCEKYIKEDKYIRLPLRLIKGVGVAATDAIIKERNTNGEFISYYDFIKRCYGFNVNKKVLENLIYAGVFTNFGINKATLIKNLDSAIMYGDLIRNLDSSLVSEPELEIVDEYSDLELMNKEIELFGYYISTHPANKYSDVMKLIDVRKYFDKNVETVIIIEKINTINTKKGDTMAFISGSDDTGVLDFVVFPKSMNLLIDIKVGYLIRVYGHVERRLDKFQIVVNNIKRL